MTTPPLPAWQRVREWMSTLSDIDGAVSLLHWDRETGMPAAGAAGRGRQIGTLSAMHHRELVRPDLDEPLEELAAGENLDPTQQAAVRLARRERRRYAKVPESLVRATKEATSHCVTVWLEAKPANDVAPFLEALAPVVALTRETADAIGGGEEPYDALLEGFEPGGRAADLQPLFAELRRRVVPIVEAARERSSPDLPERRWERAGQLALAQELAKSVGFDLGAGKIGLSAHPFTCIIHRGDVRFSTWLDEGNPLPNVMGTLHEAGHALYDQGLPDESEGTMVYDAPSMGAHESQSRFWENHVGCAAAFWSYLDPTLRRLFPDAMSGLDASDLHRRITRVRPGPTRLMSDEVTYDLHIVLRFELELALIRGDLAVADLPGAWREGMQSLLGVTPPSDTLGVMQDIHWAEGLIGYFPTYTLGNLYAAQLDAALRHEVGNLDELVAAGDFAPVLAFMRRRVHEHGSRLETRELMLQATGKELGADDMVDYLERRYLAA